MLNLCKYKDILGQPGKGVHSFRIFNVAIVDVLLTILAAYIITYLIKVNIYYSLIGMFILGIISHRLFCVKTTIDKLLFE
jgi:hypothetical protein